MLAVDNPRDLLSHVGQELGVGEWVTVDQERIDKFADATGDHQWIHVDVERAKREMPGGRTIAHGYLTLSLLPQLARGILTVGNVGRRLNYGSNKVRFTNMVPAGSRLRVRQKLIDAKPAGEGGVQITIENTIEIEGESRPAMVAEVVSQIHP